MGKSKSSSSTSSNTTNTSLSQGLQDSDNSNVISGDGNSVATTNIDGDYVGGNLSNTDYEIEVGDNANNQGFINEGEYIGGNVYEGQYAGAGTVNITDGGAFDLAEKSVNEALGFGGKALDSVEDVMSESLDTVNAIALNNSDNMRELSESAINQTVNGFTGYADALKSVVDDSLTAVTDSVRDMNDTQINNTSAVLQSLISQTSGALDANAELARSAQTGGVSVLAESSNKTMQFTAIAMAVAMAAVAFAGRK